MKSVVQVLGGHVKFAFSLFVSEAMDHTNRNYASDVADCTWIPHLLFRKQLGV